MESERYNEKVDIYSLALVRPPTPIPRSLTRLLPCLSLSRRRRRPVHVSTAPRLRNRQRAQCLTRRPPISPPPLPSPQVLWFTCTGLRPLSDLLPPTPPHPLPPPDAVAAETAFAAALRAGLFRPTIPRARLPVPPPPPAQMTQARTRPGGHADAGSARRSRAPAGLHERPRSPAKRKPRSWPTRGRPRRSPEPVRAWPVIRCMPVARAGNGPDRRYTGRFLVGGYTGIPFACNAARRQPAPCSRRRTGVGSLVRRPPRRAAVIRRVTARVSPAPPRAVRRHPAAVQVTGRRCSRSGCGRSRSSCPAPGPPTRVSPAPRRRAGPRSVGRGRHGPGRADWARRESRS